MVNSIKHTVNEFEELYLDTLIAYYVAVHYMRDRKYLEALYLSKHTLSQIENCLDFVSRSESALGAYKDSIKEEASYLEKTIIVNAKKLQVKAHAQHLLAEANSEQEERR